MKTVLFIIILLLSIYWFIPTLWYRIFSKKTVKSTDRNTIAITFDDGPSIEATQKVLKTLKQYNLKTTFFVLASSALKNKELVEHQIKDGHTIGLHGMNHKCQWFMGPFATYKDVRKSKEIITELGGNPKFFRPPWGLYNLCTVMACKKYELNWVHWSIHTYDWRDTISVQKRIDIVKNKIKSGDILLIHDGRGSDGAPEKTAQALPGIIEILHDKQLEIISL